MSSKDVTKIFGNIGSVLPLLLIFFTAAGSAYACPEHRSKAAHRTKAINTRTVSYMTPVVITYGGRCADNISGTRRVKHVSMMGDGYFEGGARYVAVRNKAPRTRYVTVRDIDYDDAAPRYVAVRRQPVYVEAAPRYVAVRNLAPRTRQVVVRDIDYDDTPRYTAVRRQPVYVEPEARYVAVRNVAPRATYVAASDLDYDDVEPVSSAVSVRSIDTDLDVEIPTRRHVVVKTDELAGTEEVIYSSPGDDIADITPPIENIVATDAAFASNAFTGVYDDFDVDDQAVLSDSGVTYVAADDMNACLPSAVIDTSPELVTTRAVSYAPVEDIFNDVHQLGTDVTHVYDDDGHSIRYRPFVNDEDLVASNTTYVMADDVEEPCACDNDVGAGTVSYVPINDVDDVDATDVIYLPVESVSDVPVVDSDVEMVTYVSNDSVVKFDAMDIPPVDSASYVPVDDSDLSTVTYTSNDSVVRFDTTAIDAEACTCPTTVSTLRREPVDFADSSAILADDSDRFAVAGLDNGYEDMAMTGYEDTLNETDSYSDDPYLAGDSDEIELIAE